MTTSTRQRKKEKPTEAVKAPEEMGTDSKIKMDVPYFQAPNDIFIVSLTGQEKLVYLYLCRCGNHGGTAFPSYQNIGESCGISRRQSMRVVNMLVDKALIKKVIRVRDGEGNIILKTDIPAGDDRLFLHTSCVFEINTHLPGADKGVVTTSHHSGDTQSPCSDVQSPCGDTQSPYKEPPYKEPGKNNNPDKEHKDNASVAALGSSPLSGEIIKIYFEKYQVYRGEEHPALKKEQYERVAAAITAFNETELGMSTEDLETWEIMIGAHFARTDGLQTDYNINHFTAGDGGIMRNLFYQNCYYGSQQAETDKINKYVSGRYGQLVQS